MEIGEVQTQGDENHARELAAAAGTARTLIGYSLEGASEAMGVSQSILKDAEEGNVPINTVLRFQMEQCYGVNLENFITRRPEWKPRTPLEYNAEQGVLRVGTLGVRFRVGVDDNDALLRGFSAAIRRQRRLPPSVPLRLRAADIPVLATLLDLEDPELDERAQFWFGQTPETAQGFRQLLRIAATAATSAA
jgi:transcriptional regulator with XRE-family HTH domain